MTRYAKGYRAECIVRDYYKRLGYTVIRAAGSKGPADLIATRPSRLDLIQVKSGGKPYGKKFRQEKAALVKLLYEFPTEHSMASVLWQVRGMFFLEWRYGFAGSSWTEHEVDLSGGQGPGGAEA